MKEREPNIEADPSLRLASEIAEAINGFVGTHEWSGDKPFKIQMADQKEGIGYIYEIRRGNYDWGADWIVIRESVSNNPRVGISYQLYRKGVEWTYLDPYLIKHGRSSLDKLQKVFDRLKIAIEAFAPKKLDDTRKYLPPSEN